MYSKQQDRHAKKWVQWGQQQDRSKLHAPSEQTGTEAGVEEQCTEPQGTAACGRQHKRVFQALWQQASLANRCGKPASRSPFAVRHAAPELCLLLLAETDVLHVLPHAAVPLIAVLQRTRWNRRKGAKC